MPFTVYSLHKIGSMWMAIYYWNMISLLGLVADMEKGRFLIGYHFIRRCCSSMNNNVGGQLSKLIEITKEIENFLKPYNSFFISLK